MRMHVTGYMPHPQVSGRSKQHTRWFENVPVMPLAGQTIHFDDYAWKITSSSLVPDDESEVTPADTGWHIEIHATV